MVIYIKHFISTCFGSLVVSILYSGFETLTGSIETRTFDFFCLFAMIVFGFGVLYFGFIGALIWSWLHLKVLQVRKDSLTICAGTAIISILVNLFVFSLLDWNWVMKRIETFLWLVIPAAVFSSVFYWHFFIKKKKHKKA